MKINKIIFFLLSMLSLSTFGQAKTDLEKEKLFGKIKSILTFSINYENEKDTIYNYKKYYHENGMEVKFVDFTSNTRFDSIVKTYDKENRIIKKIEYTRGKNFASKEKAKFEEALLYEYNNKCNKLSKIEDPNSNYKITYKFDDRCNIIAENKTENYKESSKTFEFDTKDRIIKETKSDVGEKADLEQTFIYNDKNNTITKIQFSPKKNVYYSKEITLFNEKKKVLEIATYQDEELISGKSFGTESLTIPKNINSKVKYEYLNDNLIKEINIDGNDNELSKIEYQYSKLGDLNEEKYYIKQKLVQKKEYIYENGKLIVEKRFLANKKNPDYIKTFIYNGDNQIKELITILEDGNKYSNEFLYDNFKNKIAEIIKDDGKIMTKKITKIEYFR